jgi:hypothetical protein
VKFSFRTLIEDASEGRDRTSPFQRNSMLKYHRNHIFSSFLLILRTCLAAVKAADIARKKKRYILPPKKGGG